MAVADSLKITLMLGVRSQNTITLGVGIVTPRGH